MPNNNIIKIPNKNYITYNNILNNDIIRIDNHKFYFNNIFIGDVPSYCKINNKYTLHKFNNNYIYIESDKPIKNVKYSINTFLKNKDEGYILRYALFLKDISYTNKINSNSYFSFKKKPLWFPYYMVKNENQTSLISYHMTKNNKVEVEYIFNKNKNINIIIK